MGDNFKRLRRKALCVRLCKAVLLALSVGLAVAGCLKLFNNYYILPLDLPLIILSAALLGVLSGAVLFFAMHRSTARFARQLDSTFGLDERLQTMLQFQDDPSALAVLQREDANAALSAIPPKKLKFKRLWIYLILLLVGGSIFAASLFFYPEELPPVEEPPVPFAVTDIQIAALEELTAQVKASEMTSPYREETVRILEELLTEIKTVETVAEMQETVNASIEAIAAVTDNSSRALELMEILWSTEDEDIRALTDAVNYYAWPSSDEWDKFETLMGDFRTGLTHPDASEETADPEVLTADTEKRLSEIAALIELSLDRAKVDANDPLSKALLRLADANENNADGTHLWGLGTLTAKNLDYTTLQSEIDVTLNILRGELLRALQIHAENTGTGEYAMTKLAGLFDCPSPTLKRPNLPRVEGEDGSGDGPSQGPGNGPGGGENIFGSDDPVYDPITGTYVEYGEILSRYREKKNAMIQSGVYSKEDMDAIERYFGILQGGFAPGN